MTSRVIYVFIKILSLSVKLSIAFVSPCSPAKRELFLEN